MRQLAMESSSSAPAASTSYTAGCLRIERFKHHMLASPAQSRTCCAHLQGQRGVPATGRRACEQLHRRPRLAPLRAADKPEPPGSGTSGPASGSSGTTPGGASASGNTDPAASQIVEPELQSLWEGIKKDLKKDLSPEEAQVLESVKVDDLLGDQGNLMKKLADELDPLLSSLGISEDPITFFMDVLRLGAALQLLSAGALFYGAELLGGLDSGEAFRCVGGLAVGYFSRPFFKVEQLLWPLYNWGLQIFFPGAVFEVSPSREASATTLSRLGVTVAVASFVPQLLLGWDSVTTVTQFVAPLAAGWLLFDVMFMAALLSKLQR